ncbi:MAG: glycosyltransferase [Patescibacteria group bacterium]|nr:glycosyltransferase [Patescibacteria group bacterium]
MKISLVITVLNEEKHIGELIDSIAIQSKLPDEIIIVDGGSKDKTLDIIKKKSLLYSSKLNIKLSVKKGNIPGGRNEAIDISSGNIILSTDSGCILDRKWVENIVNPFKDSKVDVVAGYHKGLSKNVFQKCLIPYVLVMADKVEKEFLPATRSMAFKKSVWKKIGGFREDLKVSEDYDFANKLKKHGFKITFIKSAIVSWIPRNNLIDSFIMFFKFAFFDTKAGILRPKAIYILLRYLFVFYLTALNIIMRSYALLFFTILLFLSYICWSIAKNYRYVKDCKAFFYLPILQFTSDFAVILGTISGLLRKLNIKTILEVVIKNKGVLFILGLYVLIELLLLPLGVPNNSHPFAYFMDEWHQSQAVRDLFRYGTPNIAGAANGSIFQFFLTGIYLIPFYVFGIVNPFAIKSSVINLPVQQALFEILRLNTLLFGILSIILISYIGKKYYKINTFLVAFFFTVNPIWLILSNYFKYDIALLFWIILSFLFLLRFSHKPTLTNYIIAGIFLALSLSTKVSAIALLPAYVIVFFLFHEGFKKWPKFIITGLLVYLLIFLFFGIPDLLLGKGSIVEYLNSNLVRAPSQTSNNYNLGMHYLPFLIFKIYPVSFGRFLCLAFIASAVLFLSYCIKKKILIKILSKNFRLKNANYFVLSLCFLLLSVSLYPLKLGAAGNRILVLLPFIAITTVLGIKFIYNRTKFLLIRYFFITIIVALGFFQSFETFSFIHIKLSTDPRVKSSNWIIENVSSKSTIGIESIPIYQLLPDVIVREFYLKQYGKAKNYRFEYEVISSKSVKLPKTIVLSNDEIESKYMKKSEKKELVTRLKKENYKKVVEFKPDFKYFNILNSELDFYMSGLAIAPNGISVFSKN